MDLFGVAADADLRPFGSLFHMVWLMSQPQTGVAISRREDET